jgi:hypothetical protein
LLSKAIAKSKDPIDLDVTNSHREAFHDAESELPNTPLPLHTYMTSFATLRMRRNLETSVALKP